LEALLRLKRLERPDAEFWSRFDEEFRSRQLAASLPKRRWWHRIQRPRRILRIAPWAGALTTACALLLVLAPQGLRTAAVSAPSTRKPAAAVPVAVRHPEPAPARALASPEPEIVGSAFVLDVVRRSAPTSERFTTVSTPETLVASATEQYSVYTLTAEADGSVF
jgi:hypothetical protein